MPVAEADCVVRVRRGPGCRLLLRLCGGPRVALALLGGLRDGLRRLRGVTSSAARLPRPNRPQSLRRRLASPREPGSSSASFAAACSASFFERPVPRPMTSPRSSSSTSNVLEWSGPCSADDPVARRGPHPALGQLLELGLVVAVERPGGRPCEGFSEEAIDQGEDGRQAAAQVDGRDDRLHRVGKQGAFSRPPVSSSPRPSRSSDPRSSARAMSASPGSSTTAARIFDSSPSRAPGKRSISRCDTARSSTASPRNSSRSLSWQRLAPVLVHEGLVGERRQREVGVGDRAERPERVDARARATAGVALWGSTASWSSVTPVSRAASSSASCVGIGLARRDARGDLVELAPLGGEPLERPGHEPLAQQRQERRARAGHLAVAPLPGRLEVRAVRLDGLGELRRCPRRGPPPSSRWAAPRAPDRPGSGRRGRPASGERASWSSTGRVAVERRSSSISADRAPSGRRPPGRPCSRRRRRRSPARPP